jgi:hypothetical protein
MCRSVEDELKRESYTDASVVAVSYLVMLGYITCALAALPPPQQLLQLFVLSRAALGAGGVLIVAGAFSNFSHLVSQRATDVFFHAPSRRWRGSFMLAGWAFLV